MRNRIDHWCTVEPGNPNPRVHRSSGKLGKASFPTGTVDPRVWISLSPLNTNDGFSLSHFIFISSPTLSHFNSILISSHLNSYHLISFHLISSQFISSHLLHLNSSSPSTSYLISSHLISIHLIISHFISSHLHLHLI